ncbi:Bax inhibitor-1/YccA family protein [Microbacterium thalli]|uniref:Bax inhibitor-1/YccA family protein n=1 Tax=Microbacterium thalli TaxID=3027921 RepID=A0ABT5SGU3_9MICO|nr:Bax inhibitor-1/YccA family protein [Microbacterium thalli]MDD7930624.1 Bax inhibitor-1/YccA family protein [Microbacterium thalli]MDD7962005.1 Bax inhibitor-1/YccA family protein [Microbacterium thalli]MDN8549704.1 Bax inhibitor-1/YccA family protein [Microbacterium thalli]
MALNNPAFDSPAFKEQRPGLTPPPAGAQTASAQHASMDAATQAQLEGLYAAPAAGAHQTDRMTTEDTVVKTLSLFAILLATAVVGWIWTLSPVSVANPNPTMMPWIIGGLGGFVLAMAVIFTSRKKVRPGLIFAYAAFEGLFVGGISAYFEFIWPGIVMQATLATVSVVGVTLALFASGKVRASAKATKIFMIAMVGYLVFSLLNVGLMLFNVIPGNMMFGLHSATIAGIPLGLIIGVLVVIMAAYSLVLDFDQVQQGVRNGAPRVFGWVGAFGIMVTVVWLYVEILRIIAILRGNN